jgi:hypothetical protein
MNFYSMKTTTDEKIAGTYPQTAGMDAGYDTDKPSSITKIPDLQVPGTVPDLDSFILSKKAKLTDVISTGLITASGFLINEKARTLFEKATLPEHKFYPAKVMFKEHKIDYFWFQIEENITLKNAIDFTRSEFELRHPLPFMKDSSKLDLHSTTDLIEAWKENTDIKKIFPTRLSLHSAFRNYSMFSFSCFWDGIVVNEQFKDEIEGNQISGFQFKAGFPISF